jgi:hypothetical protein
MTLKSLFNVYFGFGNYIRVITVNKREEKYEITGKWAFTVFRRLRFRL